MIHILFTIVMILTIITVIWDVSGFISNITKYIYEFTHPNKMWLGQPLPKILSCSYCIKFHSIWIYLIFICNTSIVLGLFIASVSSFVGILLKHLLTKLNNKLNNLNYE